MTPNTSEQDGQANLEYIVKQARAQLAGRPLYIVASKAGYTIKDVQPQLQQEYYRVNLDGTTTLIVRDYETKRLMELPGHPASNPNLTTGDLGLEDETSGGHAP